LHAVFFFFGPRRQTSCLLLLSRARAAPPGANPKALRLEPGTEALALVKATEVSIAKI